jgi:hypothetical protein
MTLFEKICLGTITVCAATLLLEGSVFVHHQDQHTATLAAGAADTLNKTNALLSQTAQMEQTVFTTAGSYSAQLAQQSATLEKSQLQLYKTITDLKEIFVRTDRSLNDVLVPKLAASLDASTALETSATRNLTDTTVKIDDTIDALRPMIDGGIRATTAAAEAMSDPAIHETATHVDGVSANLEATSADIRDFVHRETTPVRGTWNVIKAFLQEFAGPLAQVATATK